MRLGHLYQEHCWSLEAFLGPLPWVRCGAAPVGKHQVREQRTLTVGTFKFGNSGAIPNIFCWVLGWEEDDRCGQMIRDSCRRVPPTHIPFSNLCQIIKSKISRQGCRKKAAQNVIFFSSFKKNPQVRNIHQEGSLALKYCYIHTHTHTPTHGL